MDTVKQIHLRNDEYNHYIQEYREECTFDETEAITPVEWAVVERCCKDYGLTQKSVNTTHKEEAKDGRYSIILYIKGRFTLAKNVSFKTDSGVLAIRPFIIHDTQVAKRMRITAKLLIANKELSSPFAIDEEYVYEALRETAFTISLEEIEKWGKGMQSLQI